jgi:ABC-type dipeptide/oligopeptide/nickel transport system permease subunit
MSAVSAVLELAAPPKQSRWSRAWRYPSLTIGATLFIVILIAVLIVPLFLSSGPDTQDLTAILQGPSLHHLLGTDELGRDELVRLLYAGRTDLKVGVLAVLFPFCFGTTMGVLAGFYGGWLDWVVMRIVDVLVAFPFYVLVIALVFVVGTGTRGIIIAFAIADWVVYARTVRSATLVVREAEYVAAARVGGLGDIRVLARHVLPNVVTQAIIYVMTDVVLVIVAVVTLGYLGLGVQPPTPDWGAMINDGQSFITTQWWLSTIPGIAVVLTGLSLSLIGDGLADALRAR